MQGNFASLAEAEEKKTGLGRGPVSSPPSSV